MQNYTNLALAIGNYLGRTDLNDQIPLFIELAEARIYYGSDDSSYPSAPLRIRAMENSTDPSNYGVSAGQGSLALPDRFLAASTLGVMGARYSALELVAPERLQSLAGQVGLPRFAAIFGDNLRLAPTPDRDYGLIVDYYSKFMPLSPDNPSNWLLTNASGVYLYGALLEAEPYMLHDERMPVWAAMLKSLLSAMNNSNASGRFSPNAMTMRRDDMLQSAP